MAEIIGGLREDRSTHGERVVLEKLRSNLPKEFTVYVECPLHQPARSRGRGGLERYPDFIVLANFGVVVLEVKDWVVISKADKYGAEVRSKDGKSRKERNPVESAREYALLLQAEMGKIPGLLGEKGKLSVPWGSAVVLPNQPLANITQLRTAWGETQVLGLADLESAAATKALRGTLPRNYMLSSRELNLVRGVINPSVLLQPMQDSRSPYLLDREQERIVAEAVAVQQLPAEKTLPEPAVQEELFSRTPQSETVPPREVSRIESEVALNASIRLVRGVAGSGKSVVLLRRAEYLAALYPEWEICALTFNEPLARSMQAELKSTGIKAATFHKMCSGLLRGVVLWKEPIQGAHGWLNNRMDLWDPDRQHRTDNLVEFLADEIGWIKEMGIKDQESYGKVERKGRGEAIRSIKRDTIFTIFEHYQAWLRSEGSWDWADLPHMVLAAMDEGKVPTGQFDAILIDEAQDFAPVWIKVVKRLLRPEGGLLFLADDPTQSVYRYFSWREKGVEVAGRTRWLRVPYRNTREIYEAAYSLIKDDPQLMQNMATQAGVMLSPDLASDYLRAGTRPELHRLGSEEKEVAFVRSRVERLIQGGTAGEQIAVLCRRRSGVGKFARALRGLPVTVDTYHRQKGLEYEVVFLTQLDECFPNAAHASADAISADRRLVYMAMTRARGALILTCKADLAKPLDALTPLVDAAIVV